MSQHDLRATEPSVEDLLAQINEQGYEAPVIDQLNPELRTTKFTSITAYQMPASEAKPTEEPFTLRK